MLKAKLIVKDNWQTMMKIERRTLTQSSEAARETAEAIIADIRSSWSPNSPSSIGSPPAIVSGVLDQSVVLDEQGRDESGRFSSRGNTAAWYVRVDTAENDPNGEQYAQALEDPEYLDRPFMAPALERAVGMFTSNMKRFVR